MTFSETTVHLHPSQLKFAVSGLQQHGILGTEGSGTSPGVYLRDDPIFGAQLINQSELRAPTAEKAAYLLDAALAARSR
ncbi:hypothetical protein AVEN_86483-1, partial [Araneus ventricosus]